MLQTTTETGLAESGLNPQQQEIVDCMEGPMLVIAGAGSGKTRVIVHRMVNLIHNGTDPRSILLLTFTKKASEEMLDRATEMLGQNYVTRIFGGTFHHFCNRILRRYPQEAGLSEGFTILDSEDSRDLVGQCRKAVMERDTTMFDLPKSSAIQKILSMSCNHETTIEDTIRKHSPVHIHLSEAIEKIADLYLIRKRQGNCVDFDDLLTLSLKLLKNNREICDEITSMFTHVMVDEYQDTNCIQAELALLLAWRHRNIMVVGDDMQSIYSFRGAWYRNIIDFPDLLEGTKVFTLNSNYRSTPEILAFANGLIDNVRMGYPKKLESMIKTGELPEVVQFPDDSQQATWLVDDIFKEIDAGVPPEDIAVLYRAHSHSLRLQTELMRNGIHFTLRSGLKFFELAHIKDLLAFLKLGLNPRDEISLGRLLRHIPGIGVKTAANLIEVMAQADRGVGKLKKIRVKAGSRDIVEKLAANLATLKKDTPPVEASMTFLTGFYTERLPYIFDNPEERMQDVEAFVNIAADYESLEQLLDELQLLGDYDTGKNAIRSNDDGGVVLSSVHQAKGLEWHSVYILHCQDGSFPISRAIEDPERLDEEYRLFYVAITRAKKKLRVLYPMLIQGYKSFFSRLSRCVDDIPEERFEYRRVRRQF